MTQTLPTISKVSACLGKPIWAATAGGPYGMGFALWRGLILVLVMAFFGLTVPSAISTARPSAPPRLQALALPPTHVNADTDRVPKPLLFRSLHITSRDGKTTVLFSGEGDVEEIQEGHSLGMSFEATCEFTSVGALFTTWGTDTSFATMSLKNGAGQEVGRTQSAPVAGRDWVDLFVSSQPPGAYTLEITKAGPGRLGWVGKAIGYAGKRQLATEDGRVAFLVDAAPQYANSSYVIPAGFRAEALYFLGGLSTYDHGMSWWDDYEVRGDFGDRQFVGDQAGHIEVVYEDGTVDTIPLVFGWNMWWYNHFDGPEAGGPFLEPFLSDADARATLESALRLENFSPDPTARYFWTYSPRPKRIAEIRLIDNPAKQGFPLFNAISVLTDERRDNLLGVPSDANLDATVGRRPSTITPYDLEAATYKQPVDRLTRTLYTRLDSFPSSVTRQVSTLTPRIEFYGPVEADILSNVFAANLPDLLSKQDDDGKFHASGKGSINWGSYQGIGTWRPGAAPFYNQSWARDMGRALLEFTRLGFIAKAEAGVKFADSHLYDLPNGFPAINRQGQQVPPHWTTVLGEPIYSDKDGKGDGDQANDGHGLLLLAHYRVWQQKGRDPGWLKDRWPFVRDAADWYVFQLDNPSFSRATEVLYTESESARDGGFDVYSNFIALKALEKSSEMAAAIGQAEHAERWRTYAGRLKQGMLRQLTMEDQQFGKTWKPVAWNWSYAHESLGPLIIAADADGFDLESTHQDLLSVSLNTYRRQISLPNGLASPQTLGYGQSFLTQAALLADDVDAYSKALDYLARFIYYPRHMPYIVPEGVTMHPSGEYWYRNGDLGNAVHQAEVLKVLSIVAGVDNLQSGEVKVIPRLPDGWTGIRVSDYPVNDGKAKLTYTLSRQPSAYRMTINLSGETAGVQIRLGPIPAEVSVIRTTVEGKTSPARIVSAGQYRWAWISNTGAESGKDVEIQVDWADR